MVNKIDLATLEFEICYFCCHFCLSLLFPVVNGVNIVNIQIQANKLLSFVEVKSEAVLLISRQ